MTLPRDISGARLVRLLRRYGYEPSRQRGSHMTLTSTLMGYEDHLVVPIHGAVRVGTLSSIVVKVAEYLDRPVAEVRRELFS